MPKAPPAPAPAVATAGDAAEGSPAGTKAAHRRRGGSRLSADERRAAVLQVAMTEFGRGGLHGTSTETIATAAGISQPYLFRLFGTKRDLFLATMRLAYQRIEEAFRRAAEGRRGVDAMCAMGQAYQDLLSERDLLGVQLQAFAATADPVVRQVGRDEFRRLFAVSSELIGLDGEVIRTFFARGMLLNVVAALDLPAVDESWAEACQADPESMRWFMTGVAGLFDAGATGATGATGAPTATATESVSPRA